MSEVVLEKNAFGRSFADDALAGPLTGFALVVWKVSTLYPFSMKT